MRTKSKTKDKRLADLKNIASAALLWAAPLWAAQLFGINFGALEDIFFFVSMFFVSVMDKSFLVWHSFP